MAKKHKKRRKLIPDSEAKSALQKSLREINWKLLGRVAVLFVLVFSFYQICLNVAIYFNSVLIQQLTVITYTAITTLLAVIFVFINGGISSDIPTKEQLSDELTVAEKEEFIELVKTRRKKAKKILVYLIPFIFTLFFDTIYLFLFVK